jgi:chitinase
VPVTVQGDTAVEGDETVFLNLSAPVGVTLTDAQGVGTILNDDLPLLSVANATAVEGAASTATFLATLSAPTVQTVQAGFVTTGGTAIAGVDFQPITTTLTFLPGTTSASIAVPLLDDGVDELDETFTATLSSPLGAALGTSAAVGTIVDDDPTPTLSIAGPAVTETNAAQSATYTVTLSNPSSRSIVVSYASSNGTATAPADYTATSGTLTFAPGVTSQTFAASVAGDALDENDETFVVTLSNPVAAVLGVAQVTTTIVDEDPSPTLVISNVAITEGNTGTADAVFAVTLSTASGRAVTVNYATANATAVVPNDYTARNGTLTFAPGTTNQTIAVPVAGDSLDEPVETFVVDLTGPSGATIADAQGVATITDNDPAVSIVIGNVAVTEGNSGAANASFPVTLSAASGFTVTVNYATASGSAVAPGDYTTQNGTLTFTPGVTTQNVLVPIVGDLANEAASETFVVNLSAAANATIADNQAVGTITDNDPPPTIAIGDISVTEGNSGTANATFPVTLSAPSSFSVTVGYTTVNGTATASGDYSTRSGTVTFNPGVTSQSILVPVVGDNVNEPQETFVVNLSGPGNATIADAQATGTIVDNDTVSLSINNVSVTEGNSGTQNLTFTVTKTGATVQTVTVIYATADGTATQPADYSARTGTLNFAAGTTTQTISVPVLGDALDENDDTFVVNLSAATVATIIDNQGTGTIVDNDATPTLTVSGASLTEGNSGTANLTFTATLSVISGRTVTVNYATANGTAAAPADYTSQTGTLTFNPGTTSLSVVVPVAGDVLDEVNETFVVNYTNASGANLSATQVTGTITDNDPTPSVRIDDISLTEGNSGTANMNFVVTLSTVSGQAVTVNYATANGTASQPGDYSSRSGSVTIPAGTLSLAIPVPIVGDTMDEPNETVVVNLGTVSGATVSDGQATGTILDNDPAPTLSVNNVSVNESTFFSSTATFTVTLSGASSQQVTVNFATANGTATAGSDYTARTGTLTFAPGTTTQTVQVTITGDFSDEPSETFFLNLNGATVVTIADNQGLGTIVDND